jgi:hypothetical protein
MQLLSEFRGNGSDHRGRGGEGENSAQKTAGNDE